ncbi:MAG TPA: efflux RND transporter periplasmic adaptor subunit [Thermoanaerobaculaceae bacterium]|nr:efflux RND transporter periplasmic adaptor subunit [Thermoanaerobaculaceae bacterium]
MARTGVAGSVIASALGALLVSVGCKKPPPPLPPPTVLVAPAVQQDLSLSSEMVGTLDGYVNAEIRARVKGFLQTQDYADGAFVKKGQLLFTIDPAEYQAAVAKAKGALARAQATLGQAKVTADRYRPLAAKQAVSQQDLDNAVAEQQAAAATVDSAKAALDEAQLNLSYTRITSPVDGVAGTPLVRVGNLVGQGEPTLLTTVSQLDPMRVTFPISEADYMRVATRVVALENLDPLDAGPERRVLELVLADGSVYSHKGWFISLNREVAKGTGTIQVQTVFPNPDRILRPGQYARVRIPREELGKAQIVVPESAVRELQGSYTVAVVGPDDTVQIRAVEVGPRVGGLWAITKGVSVGDRVITEGSQKVSDGQKVTPKPDPSVVGSSGNARAADAGS